MLWTESVDYLHAEHCQHSFEVFVMLCYRLILCRFTPSLEFRSQFLVGKIVNISGHLGLLLGKA